LQSPETDGVNDKGLDIGSGGGGSGSGRRKKKKFSEKFKGMKIERVSLGRKKNENT
jgi:hypothetical protein